jgi:3',5'-nucleoside bisphosphate phosphatase
VSRVVIDLHTHSTASDGTDSPTELVRHAAAVDVDVLGITDHDTTAGWTEAAAALLPGTTLIPGTEFSCAWYASERRISLHLLGYLFDPDARGLRVERARLRDDRQRRARAIVDRMVADGVPISWDRVAQLAGPGVVGRPHIGRVLVENGVVANVDEAFATLLNSASRYYVRKADTDIFDAIRLLCAADGIPVFAHPRARRRGPVVDDDVIAAMTTAGLVGIEVDHPDHSPEDRDQLRGLARELGLVPTGSSDYHGTNKRTPLAACTTDPEALATLLDRNTARRPVVLSV